MSLFLTPDEVAELTGRVRYMAQRKALTAMKVPHQVRPDGRPLVLRSIIEPVAKSSAKTVEPNWDAINA